MKIYAERKRKLELIDTLIAEPYDADRVTLKYREAIPDLNNPSDQHHHHLTVPVSLLDDFCKAWLAR